MTAARPPSVVWEWFSDGTALLIATADALPDEAFREPSLLPDWTRAHVLAHLARNAEAVARLAAWAATGVESRMYPSREVRDEDIEDTAALAPDDIRAEVRTTAAALDEAMARIVGAGWDADLLGAAGNPLPARGVPELRAREVWIHLVDLDAGITFADLPRDLVTATLAMAADGMSGRDGFPPLHLTPTDLGPERRLGDPAAEPARVSGPAADLLGWLIGRTAGAALQGDPRPSLPRWI